MYRNDPKFSDRYAWANRGTVWSGSTLFAIPSASFWLIKLWQSHIVQILEWLQQIFLGVRIFRKFTVYTYINYYHSKYDYGVRCLGVKACVDKQM